MPWQVSRERERVMDGSCRGRDLRGAVLVFVILMLALGSASIRQARSSQAATPTPATATKLPAVPVAPSNLRLTGEADSLAWTDNSADETGFEITVTDNISRTVLKFSVPANTTSFQLPPPARASCSDHRPSMSYAVVAVSAVGASESATAVIHSGCPGDEAPVTADSMVVSGFASAAPGAAVVIEALDPATIRGIECARGQTVEANAAGPGYSRFSLTVDRACVQRASGKLRVCWGDGKCQGFEFQPGREVDLGVIVLRTPVASAPDVGFGPDAHDSFGVYDSARTMASAGLALVGVGILLFAGSVLTQAKRRHG